MREDISISAEGTTLRGWLYLPPGASAKVPVVILAHGLTAVKEMGLHRFAEAFAAAGLAALVYDHRNFGASDGTPRQELDPVAQVRDFRHVITYATTRPELDAERIGIWGSSFAGGHVLVVAATDRRVKCVVSQLPYCGHRNLQRLIRADVLPGLRALLDADRAQRFQGGAPAMLPVVSEDPLGPCALPSRDAWEWFSRTSQDHAPNWVNAMTLRSLEMAMDYEPASYIRRISPTPLLMIVARADHVTVADEALSAYADALEPKRLVLLDGGHFDAYEAEFARASAAATDWFSEHLSRRA